MTPVVSVIIPTYNRANLLRRAVQSVLAQNFVRLEVIIIDDGSTDNTKEVVHSFGEQVKYIYQKNGGPASARNNGIRQASGRYLTFLDSDDVFLASKIERQVEHLDKNPDDGLVYTSYILRDCETGFKTTHIAEKSTSTLEQLLRQNRIATPTVMLRKEAFDRVGPFDESMKLMEDNDLWCRIACFYAIGTIETPLCIVNRHSENLTRQVDVDLFVCSWIHLIKKIAALCPDRGLVKKRQLFAHACYIGWAMAYERNDPNAVRFLQRAILHDPTDSGRILQRSISECERRFHPVRITRRLLRFGKQLLMKAYVGVLNVGRTFSPRDLV